MMLPKFAKLSTWAASLIIDFPTDNIPILDKESNWKDWGNTLVQENSFSDAGAPSAVYYDDWIPWAEALFKAMADF